MSVMIKVKLLKAIQPFNVGEFCGFTKEQLDALPNDSYELVESKREKAARLKKEKIAHDAVVKAAEEAAAEEDKKDGGEE